MYIAIAEMSYNFYTNQIKDKCPAYPDMAILLNRSLPEASKTTRKIETYHGFLICDKNDVDIVLTYLKKYDEKFYSIIEPIEYETLLDAAISSGLYISEYSYPKSK